MRIIHTYNFQTEYKFTQTIDILIINIASSECCHKRIRVREGQRHEGREILLLSVNQKPLVKRPKISIGAVRVSNS